MIFVDIAVESSFTHSEMDESANKLPAIVASVAFVAVAGMIYLLINDGSVPLAKIEKQPAAAAEHEDNGVAESGLVDPASSGSITIDRMKIELRATGEVVVDGKAVDRAGESAELGGLHEKLSRYAEAAGISGSTPVVVLSADDGAKGNWFVMILAELEKAGIQNVTLSGFSAEQVEALESIRGN